MLEKLLRSLIVKGSLTVIDFQGNAKVYEGAPGDRVVISLKDQAIGRELALNPDLMLGQGYMDGRIEILEGDLEGLLGIALENQFLAYKDVWWLKATSFVSRLLKPLHQFNLLRRAKSNIEHHYDLSDELYRLFLDSDRQYSCAYFPSPEVGLEAAQQAKKCHLAAKLLLKPGQKLLDIGSGWGGLGLYLAEHAKVDVTGLTLSDEQHRVSNERAKRCGLERRARFLLEDYRSLQDRFDRIVSVGMFEHVGVNFYQTYFEQIKDLLKPEGVAVIHSIGRMSGPAYTSAWIRKHIFPGGYIPALSEVIPAIEQSGLWITDIEILRLHYAETLKAWNERFQANRDKVEEIYDARFCRMWEFYLVASEMFFRKQDGMVFQIQLSRSMETVPMTRDYIREYELQRPVRKAEHAA